MIFQPFRVKELQIGLQNQTCSPELACVSKGALQWSHACYQQWTYRVLSPQSALMATHSMADHHRDPLQAHGHGHSDKFWHALAQSDVDQHQHTAMLIS